MARCRICIPLDRCQGKCCPCCQQDPVAFAHPGGSAKRTLRGNKRSQDQKDKVYKRPLVCLCVRTSTIKQAQQDPRHTCCMLTRQSRSFAMLIKDSTASCKSSVTCARLCPPFLSSVSTSLCLRMTDCRHFLLLFPKSTPALLRPSYLQQNAVCVPVICGYQSSKRY